MDNTPPQTPQLCCSGGVRLSTTDSVRDPTAILADSHHFRVSPYLDVTGDSNEASIRTTAISLRDLEYLEVISMQGDESAPTRGPSDQIVEMVASWPHVELDEGRFDSTSFKVAGSEFGHLHPRLADIGYPKPLRDRLIEEGQTEEHHVVPNSNATTFRIESSDDIDHAVWLFRLSYLARLAALQRRGELDPNPDVQHELDELGPSDGVRDAFEAAITG